ncbi:MAG: serine hydrolase [Patescibacteria group bacterium]
MNIRTRTAIILIFSLVFLFSYQIQINQRQEDEFIKTTERKKIFFSDLNLKAKAVYVFDINKDEEIFEYNADSQLPLASLTKIMTALIALENIPADQYIEILQKAILEEGDNGFSVGEKFKALDLIDAMLISSSNDAAAAIALSFKDNKFLSLMNEKSKKIGLNQTIFLNPTGLDMSKDIAGAYGSAKDVAQLLKYTLENHPKLLKRTSDPELIINSHTFRNTDRLVENIPGIIASKTGFSDLAGGNLVVVADISLGHTLIFVVLGSTEEGRFEDMEKLYKQTLSYFNAE